MNAKENKPVVKLTLSAMFLAIGLVLPFFTGQIPQIGNMLLPMHIPVLLCGLICGWQWALEWALSSLCSAVCCSPRQSYIRRRSLWPLSWPYMDW